MKDKTFLDTNVLVYAYDRHDPHKQEMAQELLIHGMEEEVLVLSVQVLGEFFNVVTRQIPQPLTSDEALAVITAISIVPVQEIDLPMVNRAIETHSRFQLSYWDALIISAAERAGCRLILSEDLNDGQTYYDISVQNPFK